MIAIIGCGNITRGDDGVGPRVLHGLAARGIDTRRVKLLDAGTDGMAVMFAACGCDALIVVDACRSGAEPGAVFELPGAEVARDHEPSLNLHDFRWDHALAAGRRIFAADFPDDVTVWLIEAASTDFGIGLSPAVAVAANKVIDRISRWLDVVLSANAVTAS